jgi:hypothetical protein
MHVHIDEARRNDKSAGLDDLHAHKSRRRVSGWRYPPVPDKNVTHSIGSRLRIDGAPPRE